MARPLLTEELWARTPPLPLPEERKPKGGRSREPDHATLTGILFGLRTDTGQEHPLREMGCGSGMTCWRRLRDWKPAGVREQVWRRLLDPWAKPTRSTGGARGSTLATWSSMPWVVST
jgi:transposase